MNPFIEGTLLEFVGTINFIKWSMNGLGLETIDIAYYTNVEEDDGVSSVLVFTLPSTAFIVVVELSQRRSVIDLDCKICLEAKCVGYASDFLWPIDNEFDWRSQTPYGNSLIQKEYNGNDSIEMRAVSIVGFTSLFLAFNQELLASRFREKFIIPAYPSRAENYREQKRLSSEDEAMELFSQRIFGKLPARILPLASAANK